MGVYSTCIVKDGSVFVSVCVHELFCVRLYLSITCECWNTSDPADLRFSSKQFICHSVIIFLIKWIQTSCFATDENENISEGVNSYNTQQFNKATIPETNRERNSRGKSWKIMVLSLPWSSSSYKTHFIEGQYQPMGSSPKKIWWNLSLSMENVQSYTNIFVRRLLAGE